MVKRQTRKARSTSAKATSKSGAKMGLKKLRSSFDHMDKFVNNLKTKSKHSFSDAVSEYRAEWQRVFKREISPADAASYLKFRFGIKGKSAMTRRHKMRGGALPLPLAGAPLDYTTRPGVNGYMVTSRVTSKRVWTAIMAVLCQRIAVSRMASRRTDLALRRRLAVASLMVSCALSSPRRPRL